MGKPKLCTCDVKKKARVHSGHVRRIFKKNGKKRSPFKPQVDGNRTPRKHPTSGPWVSLDGINNVAALTKLLDGCQGTRYSRCQPGAGHPRNHVYNGAAGVARYSKNRYGKSGFFTNCDQDTYVFQALFSDAAKTSFKYFNNKPKKPNGSDNAVLNYNFDSTRNKTKGGICGHWFDGELEEIFLHDGVSVRYTDISDSLSREGGMWKNYRIFVITAYPLGSDKACYKKIKGGFDQKTGEYFEKVHVPIW